MSGSNKGMEITKKKKKRKRFEWNTREKKNTSPFISGFPWYFLSFTF